MSEKLIGSDIDRSIYKDLLENFTDFLQAFSKLLDTAETYQQNILCLKLLEDCKSNSDKNIILTELSNTLTSMVPYFLQFSILEDKLDKLID